MLNYFTNYNQLRFIWHNIIGLVFIIPADIIAELSLVLNLIVNKLFSQNIIIKWKLKTIREMLRGR